MAQFVIGLDLGQADDYTSLCVLERHSEAVEVSRPPREKPDLSVPANCSERDIIRLEALARDWLAESADAPLIEVHATGVYHCVHLERTRNVSYPRIVTAVQGLMSEPPLRGACQLVIDRTGVGRAVFDMFADRGLRPIGVSIHGGDAVTESVFDDLRVPKRDLVAAVNRHLGERRLKVADGLALKSTLESELANFRYKLDPRTSHDSYAAWREAEHDDLVLCVALALWYADRQSSRRAWFR